MHYLTWPYEHLMSSCYHLCFREEKTEDHTAEATRLMGGTVGTWAHLQCLF